MQRSKFQRSLLAYASKLMHCFLLSNDLRWREKRLYSFIFLMISAFQTMLCIFKLNFSNSKYFNREVPFLREYFCGMIIFEIFIYDSSLYFCHFFSFRFCSALLMKYFWWVFQVFVSKQIHWDHWEHIFELRENPVSIGK